MLFRSWPTITQTTDNVPIFEFPVTSNSHTWAIRNMFLIYANAQPVTNTFAMAICFKGGPDALEPPNSVYEFVIDGINFDNCFYCVGIMPGTRATIWGGSIDHIWVRGNVSGGFVSYVSTHGTGQPNNWFGHIYIQASVMAGPAFDMPGCGRTRIEALEFNNCNLGLTLLKDLNGGSYNIGTIKVEDGTWDGTNPVFYISDDILYFRGDNAYVWQLRGQNMNIMAYALTTFYVRSIDNLRLLERLEEDESFGNFTFRIDNILVSRDLLDSIMEIYFLEKHLNLSSSKDMTILDIGAGYGRLAHRMVCALSNVKKYLCTDAVAVSSFISEYYLRFRGMEERAKAVPLDEIENIISSMDVNIAVNIHSFSECKIPAIEWWLSLLEKYGVEYLMIVPNPCNHGGEILLTNDGKNFGEVIEKYGYKLVAKDPKYRDPVVQKYGINPTYHYLFELQ